MTEVSLSEDFARPSELEPEPKVPFIVMLWRTFSDWLDRVAKQSSINVGADEREGQSSGSSDSTF